MWDQDEIYAVARYNSFAVTDEADDYRLQVSGYMPPQDSAMDAGDSLGASNGVKFAWAHSTYALPFEWPKLLIYAAIITGVIEGSAVEIFIGMVEEDGQYQ